MHMISNKDLNSAELETVTRHGINFQFRLQPRSRHGKTVSNVNNSK